MAIGGSILIYVVALVLIIVLWSKIIDRIWCDMYGEYCV